MDTDRSGTGIIGGYTMKETLNIHICTTDSLRAGIDSESMTCFMCGHKTAHLDWVGIMCDTCGADTSWDFDTAGLIRSVRKRTRLSRKEIASLAGLKRETIKSYEWNGPSQKYYEWFKKFIKGYYDEKTN